MRFRYLVRCIARLVLAIVATVEQASFAASAQHPSPPKTRVDNTSETLHSVTVTDSYRWLEDQKSPETRAWIAAQNQYTQSILGSLPGRDRIRQRLEALLKIDTISVPTARGGRYFFTKRLANQNQAVIYVRNGLDGKDEVLVDPNAMSADQTTSVTILDVSKGGKLLAYGVRQGGEDELNIVLLDVDARKELPDRLPKARYFAISLKPDGSGFYYARFGTTGSRIYYHEMGTDQSRDAEVFGKGYGPTQIISTELSTDGRYLSLFVSHGSSGDKVEVYVQDLEKKGPITAVVNDLDARFQGEVAGDHMFLLTNWQASNGRVIDVDLKNPARERWRTVVPETGSVIEGLTLVGGKMFVNYLENVNSRIKVVKPSGKHVRDIDLPALGSVNVVHGRWDSDEAFYGLHSFARPMTIYRHQVATGKQDVWARIHVPLDSHQVETKQVWYESKDKTKVPMFLVHKKGIELDGNRPTLLTGYGGFNISLTPIFSARAAFWVENGGVFAMPNLRGGGEFGEKWHRAGMLDQKQNVFDDFLSAAEWLIKNGYTRPSRLAIAGGSNGGLLVGAAMTQRPELFQAVVCAYPLLDMLRYHRFLVARFWVPEYGSAENPKQFEYIYRYSPYQNVKDGTKYPAVLFITGDADTRVDPLHARKMAARMQVATASDKPVLLHYDTKAGHSAGLPVNKQIDDLTDEMSFLLWQLGVTSK